MADWVGGRALVVVRGTMFETMGRESWLGARGK
jgi:hypothetical protein